MQHHGGGGGLTPPLTCCIIPGGGSDPLPGHAASSLGGGLTPPRTCSIIPRGGWPVAQLPPPPWERRPPAPAAPTGSAPPAPPSASRDLAAIEIIKPAARRIYTRTNVKLYCRAHRTPDRRVPRVSPHVPPSALSALGPLVVRGGSRVDRHLREASARNGTRRRAASGLGTWLHGLTSGSCVAFGAVPVVVVGLGLFFAARDRIAKRENTVPRL